MRFPGAGGRGNLRWKLKIGHVCGLIQEQATFSCYFEQRLCCEFCVMPSAVQYHVVHLKRLTSSSLADSSRTLFA